MSAISIQIAGGKLLYRPGEKISGVVSWSAERASASIEVRLFWFTTGESPRQIGMVATTVFSRAVRHDNQPFEFVLPAKPWSFEGRLAGLYWAVEAVLLPTRACARTVITVSPDGQVISLRAHDQAGEGIGE
jgi:hypothetical protein